MLNNQLPDLEYYYLYIYNTDNKHDGKIKIEPSLLNNAFVEKVKSAINSKLKVIITDEYDNCMFHSERGQILFPKL